MQQKKQRSGYRCFNFVFKKRQFVVSMTISLTGFLLRRRCRNRHCHCSRYCCCRPYNRCLQVQNGNTHFIQHAVEYLSRCKHDTF